MKATIPLLTLALLAVAQPSKADSVGMRALAVRAPERGADLEVLVWYPAKEDGTASAVGNSPLFKGTPARLDASPVTGRFPLILISHGSGGHAANVGWLATRLVAQGFIVAAPNHPGSTTGNASPRETIKIWNRPADISAVLTAMTADPGLRSGIDQDHVGVLGFSLGGHTALALAGARVEADSYARYCRGGAAGPECAWFARGGVDFESLEPERFNRSNHDPRIKAVVAVDPALAQAYVPASLSAISVSTFILNLGRPGLIIPAVEGTRLARSIPGAGYATVPDAIHFSFLGECKPEGPAVLRAEGDEDPLCDDGGTRPRAALHAEMAEMIARFFKRHLKRP